MRARTLGLSALALAAIVLATNSAEAYHRRGGIGFGVHYQPYTSYYYAPSYAQPYAPYGRTYDPYPATYYAPSYRSYGYAPVYRPYGYYPRNRSFGFSIGRGGFGFGFSRW